MAWYPVALLFALIPGSFNAFVVSAYVLASSFAYGYVYTLTGSRLGALVGGITYGMSGFFMVHLGHTMMIHSVAWIPLVIWALEKLRTRPHGGWVAALAVAVGFSALAGHPQVFLYMLLLAAGYALFRGWGTPGGWRRYYGLSLAGGALGVCLGAVMFLPALELSEESVRSRLNFSQFAEYSLPWMQVPQLFFPYLFGGSPWTFYDTPYFGHWNLTELMGYVGLIPLVLAGLGVALSRKASLTWFWAAVAFVSVLLALGDNTPLAKLLFHLPVYNRFRAPARHSVEFSLAVSVLAGFGTAAVVRLAQNERLKAVRYASIVMAGLALVVLIAVFALSPTIRGEARETADLSDLSVLPWANPAVGVPLLVLIGGLGILWWWSKRPSAWRSALLIAILVIDLGSFGWFYEWHFAAPAEAAASRPQVLEAYQTELSATSQRLAPLHGGLQPVHLGAPNLTRLWDVPSASGFNPLVLRRYGVLLGMADVGRLPPKALEHENRALDLLAVRYLFVPTATWAGLDPACSDALAADPTRWRHVEDLPLGTVYENPRAMPRAWLVPEVMSLRPDEILVAIQQSRLPDGRTYDPSMVALVEEPVTLEAQDPASQRSAQVIRLSDTSIEVRTYTEAPAFLVLSDVYYPGWRATIDGEPTHVLRANYVLRGVMLSPGVHVVRFEFRPTIFYAGAGVSALAALAVAGMLAWPLVRISRGFVSGRWPAAKCRARRWQP